MEASFIYADKDDREMNTSRYRIFTPAKYLEKAGHAILIQHNAGWSFMLNGKMLSGDPGIDYTKLTETVLVERLIMPDWVDKMRVSGAKRIIVTFDDHYGAMADSSPAKDWWNRNYGAFLKALGMVDLVIVPSLALVDVYKQYCRKIEYVPNFIDDDLWTEIDVQKPDKVIGWGGSYEHIDSWKQKKLTRAIAQVLEKNPDWKLFLIGPSVPKFLGFFPKGVQVQWQDWLPHTEWPKAVSKFTIGLAPLHGEYDRYRSNLKLIEYGLAQTPWIASFLDPYSRTHVRGGVLAHENGWHEALSLMVRDESARRTLSRAGSEWADGYRMSRNVSKYEEVLWNK